MIDLVIHAATVAVGAFMFALPCLQIIQHLRTRTHNQRSTHK